MGAGVPGPHLALVSGQGLVDEVVQRLHLGFVGDGAHNGIAHDVAVAVHHIGGGVGEHILHKLAGLALGGEVDIGIGDALLGQNGLGLGEAASSPPRVKELMPMTPPPFLVSS